jgi:hypothetical protein
MITFSEWRRERIFAYLNPWDEKYTLGKAYQLSHSLIAFGRGEIFGQGLGSSVEKLHYLPEAHTDFLLAVIGEELGFSRRRLRRSSRSSGWRGASFPHRPPSGARSTACSPACSRRAIGIWVGGQAFINMGVNLGVLPTKGLTLAADELRRLGDRDERDRARHRAALRHRESATYAWRPRMSASARHRPAIRSRTAPSGAPRRRRPGTAATSFPAWQSRSRCRAAAGR